jgi:hypothetical protein
MVSGCDGSQPPIAAPGTIQRTLAIATHAVHGESWMLPEAKGRNLLYVAADDVVDVFSYPRGKLLGALGSFDGAEGLCADKAGDVFVTAFYDHEVFEYAHGGTKAIAVLNSPYSAYACSVDPKTENVAVASPDGVAIFPYNPKRGYRFAKAYRDSDVYLPAFCGYDGQGNLFVDGTAYLSGGFAMSALENGATVFTSVTLDQRINGPGAVQWDGKTLAVADRGQSSGEPAVIYRFVISGSTGMKMGSVRLSGSTAYAQFWLQGGKVIGPESGSTGGIGLWDYPKGGAPVKSIMDSSPFGETVSLK